MVSCDHNCSSCQSKCEKEDFLVHSNEYTHIKKVIGVVSGKGGVGKSLVTSLLAIESAKQNYKVAILDGDILGPSIPKIFGVTQKAYGDESGKFILPAKAPLNIDIISSAMLLEHEDDPIVWRGSLVSNMVKQFYGEVVYGEQDILYVDMPPGTGDVTLTTFQSLPLDGIIIVTSPQDLVNMIVSKAVKMANMMNIPIIGLVENYSFIKCPNCDETIELFGHSKAKKIAVNYHIKNCVCLPLDQEIASLCDEGKLYEYSKQFFNDLIKDIQK